MRPSQPEFLCGPGLEVDPTVPSLLYYPDAVSAADAMDSGAIHILKEMPLHDRMTPRSAFGQLPVRDRLFISHFEHERDHMLRAVGTTFGLLLLGVRQMRVAAAINLLRECGSSATFPLFQRSILRTFLTDSQQKGLPLLEQIGRLSSHDRLHVLYGLSEILVHSLMRDTKSTELWPALGLLSHVLGADCAEQVRDSFRDYVPSNPSSSPLLAIFPTRALRIADLLEFCAVRHQLNMVCLTGTNDPSAFALLEDRVAEAREDWSEYRFVDTVWHRIFPKANFLKETIREASTTLRGFWRVHPLELLAAVDLALWVPFGPQGGAAQGLTWLDLAPHWRFCRILRFLADKGAPMTLLPKQGGNEQFLSLQSEWCESFGWPAPNQQCSDWLTAYTEGTVTSLEVSADSRWTLTKGIFEQRLQDPISVAISMDYNNKPASFPLIVRPVNGHWERIGDNESINRWLISESLLKTASRRIGPQLRSNEEADMIVETLTSSAALRSDSRGALAEYLMS